MNENRILLVHEKQAEFLTADEVTIEKVGAKAYGLFKIPCAWTLPFFVISPKMYEMHKSQKDTTLIEKNWASSIIKAMEKMGFDLDTDVFLRSNMCVETLENRGEFESHTCSAKDLLSTIKKYFDEISSKNESSSQKVALLVQKYSRPLSKGHLSNEKRLSKNKTIWNFQIKHGASSPIKIQPSKDEFDESQKLQCPSLADIPQSLKSPCTWATKQDLYIHFEWIFDGIYIYIVQADEAQTEGINPESAVKNFHYSSLTEFLPQILCKLSLENKERYSHYSKIQNPLIYSTLGLKTAPIYILENQHEIERLLNNEPSIQLKKDITFLISQPLVIRTDVDTKDIALRQMLPRTDSIRRVDDAIDWLVKTSKSLHEKHNGELPFMFILHNFIPAVSSAFAYAKPNSRLVLIESLWGVPEGLYYYAHDKHTVDTKNEELEKVKKYEVDVVNSKINPKTNFIFPDDNGNWKCNHVDTNYIWKHSISKKQLCEMAISTREIAEKVKEGVSVMWFVGVNPKIYACDIFPWHHERYEYEKVSNQTRRKKDASEDMRIETKNDIEKLKRIEKDGNRENIKYILLRPIEDSIIRDKDIIEDVGTIANNLGATIMLEGGMLSHAYYQLKRTGVGIELENPFDEVIADTQYNKLVRDKIPEKIKSGGETVVTDKLSDDDLFKQLKIKLIEEAFEVLSTDNANDLIHEIADVLEVIDSIVRQQKLSKEAIDTAQANKREKVGGFEEGILLEKTALQISKDSELLPSKERKEPLLTGTSKGDVITKWIEMPLYLQEWSAPIQPDRRTDINVTVKGKRENATLKIEVRIHKGKQLSLFKD